MAKKKSKHTIINDKNSLLTYVKNHWQLYVMLLPPLIVLLIFAYGPMGGIILAFKNFEVTRGIWGSPWAPNYGMNNFIRFFNNFNFTQILGNTLVISLYSMVVNTLTAVLLALSLNYVRKQKFKKTVQMISYLPFFISTIVFVGIINSIFDRRVGVFGRIMMGAFGIDVLASPDLFPSLFVWTGVWQGVGFGAIIYMAALSGVDYEQHEAAIIDGATLLQRIRHVDLPAVFPTIAIMLILNMGGILNIAMERILAMQNLLNITASEVITTYVYKVSFTTAFPDFSLATAVGLFQSGVGLILILLTNFAVKKLSGVGFL